MPFFLFVILGNSAYSIRRMDITLAPAKKSELLVKRRLLSSAYRLASQLVAVLLMHTPAGLVPWEQK